MRSAGVVVFLMGTLLAAGAEISGPAGSHETAADRLGIAFAPRAVAAGDPAPATNSQPVIVLPKFDVRASRIDLAEHDLLTPKGRLAEAKRRELSPLYRVTFGPLAFAAAIYFDPLLVISALRGTRPNDAEAMVLFEQDERLRHMHEADSLIDVYKADDPALYRELKTSLRESFRPDMLIIGGH